MTNLSNFHFTASSRHHKTTRKDAVSIFSRNRDSSSFQFTLMSDGLRFNKFCNSLHCHDSLVTGVLLPTTLQEYRELPITNCKKKPQNGYVSGRYMQLTFEVSHDYVSLISLLRDLGFSPNLVGKL